MKDYQTKEFWKKCLKEYGNPDAEKERGKVFICSHSETFHSAWASEERENIRDLAKKWGKKSLKWKSTPAAIRAVPFSCVLFDSYSVDARKDFMRAMIKKFS